MRVLMKAAIRVLSLFALCSLAVATVSAHGPHPLGKEDLHWSTDTSIKRTLAMNIDFHGGDWFVIWRQPGRVETIEGRACLVGPYFFFDVNDEFAFDIDEEVTVEVLVDRRRTDGFNLSWDQAVRPTAQEIRLSPDYQDHWETVTVKLDRARFANRKYEGTDFAIGALGAKQPQPEGVNGELAVCQVKVLRSNTTELETAASGTLALAVHDEYGEPTSVRFGLYDVSGRSPLPSDAAVTLNPFAAAFRQWPLISTVGSWPSPGRYISYINGVYDAAVPPGSYDLVLSKGPEYRLLHRKVDIRPGEKTAISVQMQRWIDMPARGWYSGDDHIHVARPDRSLNPQILAFTSAEDIHVANLVQMTNVGSSGNFRQYAFGSDGHYIDGHHALVPGQESPRSSHRGHTLGLNATELVISQEEYFVYDRVARKIRELGGLWGYAHVAIDAFNVDYGLALDVPLGVVDFLEVLQMGMLNTAYLYDFLNMGYQLLPAAGSDYPYIHIAGSERIYARTGPDFSPRAWFESWQQGRSFVSNGPIIDFSVGGDSEGSEYHLAAGDGVLFEASAAVNPDIDRLVGLELIQHGEVISSVNLADGSESLQLSHTLYPTDSSWVVLKAYGEEGRVALTRPVYLYVDGDTRTWKRAEVPRLARKYMAILADLSTSVPDLNEDWERSDTEQGTLSVWNANKALLQKSIEQALAAYETLIVEATSASEP